MILSRSWARRKVDGHAWAASVNGRVNKDCQKQRDRGRETATATETGERQSDRQTATAPVKAERTKTHSSVKPKKMRMGARNEAEFEDCKKARMPRCSSRRYSASCSPSSACPALPWPRTPPCPLALGHPEPLPPLRPPPTAAALPRRLARPAADLHCVEDQQQLLLHRAAASRRRVRPRKSSTTSE